MAAAEGIPVYLALTVAGVVWAFLLEDGNKLRDSSALCLFWSWYNILVLTIACVVCIEQPRMRASERLAAGEGAIVHAGKDAFACRILDISLGGARLAGTAPGKPGTIVTVALGSLRLPGKIVRSADDEFAIHFDEVGKRARRSHPAHLLGALFHRRAAHRAGARGRRRAGARHALTPQPEITAAMA